jgi:anti-sigma regulatory factor (Ser/Thr protein kinase)
LKAEGTVRDTRSAPPGGFVHQALIYESEQEFVDGTLPFVLEGIKAGEPVLVAVQAPNIEALQAELGPDPGGVVLRSVDQWYETSARTRAKFARWVSGQRNGGRVRLVGEPPWPLASAAGIRDWARHEAVLNVAFADLPLTFICPYDARALPPGIIEHAQSTHPEILHGATRSSSSSYAEPAAFCHRLDHEILPRSGPPTAEIRFGADGLAPVRRLVERDAAWAGLSHQRARDLAVAVSEVAANAVTHGGGAADIRIYREPGELVCEITDAGGGLADALAGQLEPDLDRPGGWGIWMARLLADALEITSGPAGTVVSVHASAP